MLVVASTTNCRTECPKLAMSSLMLPDSVGKSDEWSPVFKRGCSRVVVTGEKWYSLVHVRGSMFDIAGVTDEIRVSGTRCPIHRVDKVCTIGNKSIVDLVVAIDPTCVEKHDGSWSFDVSFPLGFTPMCYSSKGSSLQHIAILFKETGVMAIDVSPVSYTLLWDTPDPCRVLVDSKVIAEEQFHKLEVLNTSPGETFSVRVESSSGVFVMEVTTPWVDRVSMGKFYRSRKRSSDEYDLEGVEEGTVKYLRKNGILKSGHRVRVTPKNSSHSRLTSVVVSGDTVPLVKGNNMYVIPDFSVEDSQFICLEDDTSVSHVIEFDKSESFVKYRDRVYPHGSNFLVQSRAVSVVQGSIILEISADVPFDFPGGDSTALQTVTSGDLVIRDVVMRSSSQVVEKVVDDTTYGKNSFFVYNSSDGTTTECTRFSHGLNAAGDTGSVTVGLLYTDSDSNTSIVNAFTTTPSCTTITSRDDTETVTATFNSAGLSFDSDNGNIYFGADKDFRIHFAEESGLDPAMLQIQSLSNSEYVTRFLITSEPP